MSTQVQKLTQAFVTVMRRMVSTECHEGAMVMPENVSVESSPLEEFQGEVNVGTHFLNFQQKTRLVNYTQQSKRKKNCNVISM